MRAVDEGGLRVSASPMLGPLLVCSLLLLFFHPPLVLSIWAIVLLSSALLGRWNLRALEAEVELPSSAFAWESIAVRLKLRNRARAWAVRDLLVSHAIGADRLRRNTAYHPRLLAGDTVLLQPPAAVPRRGRHLAYHLQLRSSFPFGLLRWERQLTAPIDLLGLPRLGELRQMDRVLPEMLRVDQLRPRGSWRPGEYFSLQEWRPGVPQRQIAWKASARRGEILVRQNQQTEQPAMHVVLHLRTTPGRDRAAFERAVSLTATLLEHLLRRRQPVRLTLHGRTTRSWRPRPGRAGLNQVLVALAEIEADPRTPARLPTNLLRSGSTVIVTASPLALPALRRSRTVLDTRSLRRLRRVFREARAMPLRTRLAHTA